MMRTSSYSNRKNWIKGETKIDGSLLLITLVGLLLTQTNVLNSLTPFGIAFLGAFVIMRGSNIVLLCTILFGTIIYHGSNSWGYLLASLSIYGLFKFVKKENSYSLLKASFLSSLVFCTSRALILLTNKDLFIYDFLIVLFESLLVFTMIYIFTFSLPIDRTRTNFNNENIVCSFITLALVLTGVNNLTIFDVNIKNMLSIVIIMYLSYGQGALVGGTTGIIIGMIAYISNREMPFIMSIFGVAGLLAGIFKDLGSPGAALGFLLGNGIISFYINGLGTSFLNIRELILAISIFLITNRKVEEQVARIFEIDINSKKDYVEKRDEIVIKKLNRMADLFESLSTTFKESSAEREIHSTGEIYGVVDNIANQLCKHCYKYDKCWRDNYYRTYQNFFNLVGLVEIKTGEDQNVHNEAKKFCLRYGDVIESIDRAVEKIKLSQRWKLKLKENRLLLSEQLEGVGNIVKTITRDIYSNAIFNNEIEKEIYKELKNNRMDVREVSVTQIGQEDYEIYIDLNQSIEDKGQLKMLVSKLLGFPVTTDGSFRDNGKTHRFKLIRHNRYSAITKVANMPNSENRVSGDSFTFGEVDSTHFSAISDGMGIGRRASEESKMAIGLLEKLMEANMDKNLTLRTINSVLRAKSNEEMFTTLDLSFIDLYTGKLQVIKTGAPSTFIKKKDRVDIINANSLPVGLLKDIDFNIYEEYVEDGDIIIMVSDGVLDIDRDKTRDEEWMKNLIMTINSPNPQTMAREILERAKGSITSTRDDMTVLVTKVWKNVS